MVDNGPDDEGIAMFCHNQTKLRLLTYKFPATHLWVKAELTGDNTLDSSLLDFSKPFKRRKVAMRSKSVREPAEQGLLSVFEQRHDL